MASKLFCKIIRLSNYQILEKLPVLKNNTFTQVQQREFDGIFACSTLTCLSFILKLILNLLVMGYNVGICNFCSENNLYTLAFLTLFYCLMSSDKTTFKTVHVILPPPLP